MPAFVKNSHDEKLWAKAKVQVHKQYPELSEDNDRFWKLCNAIFHMMAGKIEKSFASLLQELDALTAPVWVPCDMLKARQVREHERRGSHGQMVHVRTYTDPRDPANQYQHLVYHADDDILRKVYANLLAAFAKRESFEGLDDAGMGTLKEMLIEEMKRREIS